MKPMIFLSTISGNILEYFDFLLFAHFSFILTPLFFQSNHPLMNHWVGLGLFSVGFLMRPLGGLLFGTIGDVLGRQHSLSRSILWIALPTFCIGCMPTYEQIGYGATFAVLICRMIQGLSLGGEYSNAGIFLMEHAQRKKRGFYSGLLVASGSVGSLMGLGCVWCVVHTGTTSWAWRIPFLVSALLGMISYKVRQYISETPDYIRYMTQKHDIQDRKKSAWAHILTKKKTLMTVISIGALVSVMVWIPVTYTSFYLTQTVGWSAQQAMPMVLFALINYIVFSVVWGVLGDRIGFFRIMQWASAGIVISVYPLFYSLVSGYVLFAQWGFTFLAAMFGASVHAVLIELYPTEERCRAISVGISTGIALGGASPMIAAWLVNVTGNPCSPALYIIMLGLLGGMATKAYQAFIHVTLNNPKLSL